MTGPRHLLAAPAAAALPAGLAALVLLAACAPGPGDQQEAVRMVVEQAVTAAAARDFEGFIAAYTGDKAGRYREELETVHGGDVAAFFASKRGMVVTGPVHLSPRAFATVPVFVIQASGHKPVDVCRLVFSASRWQIDSFLPGDITVPRTDDASAEGVVALLQAEAAAPRQEGSTGTFQRIQVLRAMEVVGARRLQGARQALEILVAADDDPGLRQFSAHLLGKVGADSSVLPLLQALEDRDARVRGEAALSLAALKTRDVVPRLQTLRRDDASGWVQAQAATALSLIGAD